MIGSIISFFVITGLLGHGLILLATGRRKLTAETCVLAPGAGLALFVVLALFMNVAGVPLAWWSFLAAAFLFEAAGQYRALVAKKTDDAPFATWDDLALAAAALLGVALFAIMLHGEFAAPWLNDDDSWEHASTAKYIAVHHTYTVSTEVRPWVVSYLEPYPPGYPALIGVCHQFNRSVSWTLRFFNVLLVALAMPWFYLAAREYTGRAWTALWMTGMLWAIPCFMSHFVWAQTLAVTLFFPAFFALERSRRDPAWAVVAAVAIAAIALTQPSAAAVFGMMAGLAWVAHLVSALLRRGDEGRWNAVACQAAAAVAAVVVAAAFYLPEYVKFGWQVFRYGITKFPISAPGAQNLTFHVTELTGTGGGVSPSFWDFAYSPAFLNKINQPTGVGFVLFGAAVAGLLLACVRLVRFFVGARHAAPADAGATEEEERARHAVPLQLILVLWLLLGVAGIEGNRLHFAIFPHRFWVFFAIPAAMLAGEFLAWAAEHLSWKVTVAAAVAGIALGAALVFGTVAERLALACEALPENVEMTLSGTPLILFFVSLLLAAAATAAGIYFAVNPKKAAAKEPVAAPAGSEGMLRFAGIAAVVAGILVTSAYGKARLEGFVPFPPGVRFYIGPVFYADGRPAIMPNGQQYCSREEGPEMQGYLALQRGLDPDTPVLVLNGPDDHAVGFDMWALPYDNEITTLRARVDVVGRYGLPHAAVADEAFVKDAVALAKAKGFRFVMVDLWRAAECQHEKGSRERNLGVIAQSTGLSQARVLDLLNGAAPGEDEKKVLPSLRAVWDDRMSFARQEEQALDVAERLRNLLRRDPGVMAKPVLDTGRYGIAVFELRD